MKNTLKEDFKARKTFYSNRASAIFPIHFKGPENDLIISFLNYWTIKNRLPAETIIVNLRIYDQDGSLHTRSLIDKLEVNNILSVREYVNEDVFFGMIEIEVVSSNNLAFTFPAITGIYKSNSLYSCVHSAGRIKGPEEQQTPSVSVETNWSCKFKVGIKPFFHYVNGNTVSDAELRVNLYSGDGEEIGHRVIKESFHPFASKMYFVDEIFGSQSFESLTFVGVSCMNDSVFRRMVVGNFHEASNHLEVTHSFPLQGRKDLCPKVDSKSSPESFLACYNDEQLDLGVRIFPTNCNGDFSCRIRGKRYGGKKLELVESKGELDNGYGLFSVPNNYQFYLMELRGDVPSRFNSNFIYKVKGIDSSFSTDIATGAKSTVYPPKVSHWGSGLIGEQYDFVLLLRNNKHDKPPVSGYMSAQ
jgi:hypothetical protein